MKRFFTLFGALLLIGSLQAQTLHIVEAGGTPDANTPDPYFSPQFLNIEVGDTVRWENIQGWHSIDGTQASFPDNPESFSSGAAGSGWTYEFVFTIAGVYDYECPVGSHADTQFGTITVEALVSSVSEAAEVEFNVYPNPASDQVSINAAAGWNYSLVNHLGQRVQNAVMQNETERLDLSEMNPGSYLLLLEKDGERITKMLIIQ